MATHEAVVFITIPFTVVAGNWLNAENIAKQALRDEFGIDYDEDRMTIETEMG